MHWCFSPATSPLQDPIDPNPGVCTDKSSPKRAGAGGYHDNLRFAGGHSKVKGQSERVKRKYHINI